MFDHWGKNIAIKLKKTYSILRVHITINRNHATQTFGNIDSLITVLGCLYYHAKLFLVLIRSEI